MSLAYITFNQIIVIFIIIMVGFLCSKIGLINDQTNQKLSNILLMLVNPMVIFVSYQREYEASLVRGLLISLLLSTITHVFSIGISYIFFRNKKKEKGKTVSNPDVVIERFFSIYSNVGFVGIPLVNGIFGGEGVFYVTGALTMFNVFLWTHGIIAMSGTSEFQWKDLLRKIMNPSIIAVVLGLIMFFTQIRLPNSVLEAFQHIANLNTPFAMIIAGVTIANTKIWKTIFKIRVYYVSLMKLLIIPVVLAFLFLLIPMDKTVYMTAVVMAAVPSGATGILFAIRYGKNSELAAELFAITTVLSALTIPIIVTIGEYLYSQHLFV